MYEANGSAPVEMRRRQEMPEAERCGDAPTADADDSTASSGPSTSAERESFISRRADGLGNEAVGAAKNSVTRVTL